MDQQAKLLKKRRPYLFEYYNVRCYSSNPLSEVRSGMARLVNALIKVLNNKDLKVLPRMIVIIPDEDLIKSINYFEFGISKILESAIKWVVTNMQRAIEAKKQNMLQIRLGAVESTKPKFVWVKMLSHPNGYSHITALRSKFNTILENILAGVCSQHILDVNYKLNFPQNYTLANMMNQDGRVTF